MVVTGKRADGYLINCDRQERCRGFVVETLEPVIRCPSCGQRKTLVDLTTSYLFLQRASRIAREAKARRRQAANSGPIANDLDFMPRSTDRVA